MPRDRSNLARKPPDPGIVALACALAREAARRDHAAALADAASRRDRAQTGRRDGAE